MRYIIILSLCILSASCGKKEEERPADILTKDQMVSILQDIYLTESKISKLSVRFDSSKVIFGLLENDIYKDHGIGDSTYQKSVKYYYNHPDDLLKVYEMLVDSLALKEQSFQEKYMKPEGDTEKE